MGCQKWRLAAQSIQERGGEKMLRTGIYLFCASSAGVAYRCGEYLYSMHPLVKYASLLGLLAAFTCFAVTYLHYELPRLRKLFTRRLDMIKSPAWKLSSMA